MVWKNSLVNCPNHWFTDFIVNQRNFSSISSKPWSNTTRLELKEVDRYPALDIVNIHKVFKDKRDRLHYFSLSQPETIDFFLAVKDLWKTECFMEWIDHPNYRVRKIFLRQDYDIKNHEYLYCLPQVNVEPKSRQRS